MSKKAIFYNTVKKEGVSISEATNMIEYLRETSKDNLAFTQQFFIVPQNTNFTEIKLNLKADALFTYFFEEGADVLSSTKLKINGLTTEFNIAPDLWLEEYIESLEVENLTSQDKLVYVYQLYPQGVIHG